MGIVVYSGAGNDIVNRRIMESLANKRPKHNPRNKKRKAGVFQASDRDIAIRTIIGEAANEGVEGWAAVAHNLRNRVSDSRYPDTLKGVALQPLQYSAWNEKNNGGNHLVDKYKAGDKLYESVGKIVDGVMSGQIKDKTNGAVNYYANGTISPPRWWASKVKEAGGTYKQIGGHRFAGKSDGKGVDLGVFETKAQKVRREIPLDKMNAEQKKQFSIDKKPIFEEVVIAQDLVADDMISTLEDTINNHPETKKNNLLSVFQKQADTAMDNSSLQRALSLHDDLETSTQTRN